MGCSTMSRESGCVNQEFVDCWTDSTLPAAVRGCGARNVFIAADIAPFNSILPIMRWNIKRVHCKTMK